MIERKKERKKDKAKKIEKVEEGGNRFEENVCFSVAVAVACFFSPPTTTNTNLRAMSKEKLP